VRVLLDRRDPDLDAVRREKAIIGSECGHLRV
jgi:hypothetical protein